MKYFAIAIIGLLLFLGCDDTKSRSRSVSNLSQVNKSKEVNSLFSIPPTKRNNNKVETKLIKTGRLNFETKDLEATFVGINKQIQNLNGYIQSDETNKSYDRITRSLVIRIPKGAFQTIVDSIAKEVDYFDSKQISLTDVTEEFIDVTARIKTKKKLEDRYLALLPKAKTVQEMLAIERELSKIREEIDAKQGRLNYLNSKINLSTLTVVFYKKTASKPSEKQTYLSKIKQAFSTGINIIAEIVLFIFSIWPLLIIGFLVYLWILKKI
jgi:hypothetical protein